MYLYYQLLKMTLLITIFYVLLLFYLKLSDFLPFCEKIIEFFWKVPTGALKWIFYCVWSFYLPWYSQRTLFFKLYSQFVSELTRMFIWYIAFYSRFYHLMFVDVLYQYFIYHYLNIPHLILKHIFSVLVITRLLEKVAMKPTPLNYFFKKKLVLNFLTHIYLDNSILLIFFCCLVALFGIIRYL